MYGAQKDRVGKKLNVLLQKVCDGNNMRWEEELHFSAFVNKCKVL